ncbi:MAG: spore germination protein [Bacillota bacterium]
MLAFIRSRLGRRPEGASQARTAELRGERPLYADLDQNIRVLKQELGNPADLAVKEFLLGGRRNLRGAVLCLDTLADETLVNDILLTPLMIWARQELGGRTARGKLIGAVRHSLATAKKVKDISCLDMLVTHILRGDTVFLADGVQTGLVIETKGWPARAVAEPSTEVTTRGPHLGFNETIKDNLGLVRLRFKTPGLMVERLFIGDRSKTDVRILYHKDLAPPQLVAEVRRRLRAIETDVVLDSGVIQNLISDHRLSLFLTTRSSERPDSVVADLNDGRVAVLVDGTPFVITMPNDIYSFFASPEDNYIGYPVATLLRLMRFQGFFISTFATPFYIAMVGFHQELIPLPLLLNIASTQGGVPFPLAVTAVLAEIVVEVLREAGVRLPKQFGPAVSIVGALVLGQAAIQAGFISPGLVIVVTTATIASFAVPRSEAVISFRLLRFPFLLLGTVLGFYGLALGMVAVTYHVAAMKSFGVPFLSMYAPGRVSELGEKPVLLPEALRRPVRPAAYRDRTHRGPLPAPKDPNQP